MKIGDHNVEWLGDPHMGRKFKTGVPLHRLGDREEMQWKQLEDELLATEADVHVCMGDIFDKFIVSPETVLRVAGLYHTACEGKPNTQFILIKGNHDVSRNAEKASSFDLLLRIVQKYGNMWVVDQEPVVWENLGFVPYDPFHPTTELLAELPDDLDAVFGHWDVVDFGGENVLPAAEIAAKGIKLAITGHDHTAREEIRNGVRIIVTGSMQPYTHGEDPEQKMYITLPVAELYKHDLTNMNVRVLLEEGETLPTDLNCLSLTGKRVAKEGEEEISMADFEGLDLNQQLSKALEENPMAEKIMQFFEGARHS